MDKTNKISLKKVILLCICSLLFNSISIGQISAFQAMGTGGGGYMYAPSLSPHDTTTMFVNCDMAGVYKTTNGGNKWQLIDNQQLVSTTKSKVQFTADPNVLYAVHRLIDNSEDAPISAKGIPVKSVDGGAHWFAIHDPSSTGIHFISADPKSTQNIIINEYDKIFFSNDGGISYKTIYIPSTGIIRIAGVVWDNESIIIGTNEGLLVSRDNGLNFNVASLSGIPSGEGIFHLTHAKDGAEITLFCVTAHQDYLAPWNDPRSVKDEVKSIYRLKYETQTFWQKIRNNIPLNYKILWVDNAKNNANIIWATAEDDTNAPFVYKSVDGGNSWTNTFNITDNMTSGWAGGYESAFWYYSMGVAWGMDVDQNNPDRVLLSDGYCHYTTDGGNTWRQMYVDTSTQNPIKSAGDKYKFYQSSGLNVTSSASLHFIDDSKVMASCYDIGNQYTENGGETWTFGRNTFHDYGPVSNNNWYRIVENRDKKVLYAALSGLNDIYQDGRICDNCISTYGLVLTSMDEGKNWDTLLHLSYPVVWIEISPIDPDILMISVAHHTDGGIFLSKDAGKKWQKTNNPPRTQGRPNNIRMLLDGSVVVSYAARPDSNDGQSSDKLLEVSGVFLSHDLGQSWEDRSHQNMKFFTKDLIIDPHEKTQNTWYAAVWGRFTTFPGVNNQGNGGLYKTTDRGITWQRIFKNERTESCAIHPNVSNRIYVSTEYDGLYVSTENEKGIYDFQRVENYPYIRPKRIFFNPFTPCEMWVTTMGGGIWKAYDIIHPTISAQETSVCVNKFFTTKVQNNISTDIFWQVENGTITQGQGTSSIEIQWTKSGTSWITVEFSNGLSGCNTQDSAFITINPSPVAEFTFTQDDKTFTFKNESMDATQYLWDFGDNNTSTEISPIHTYDNFGSYTVKLISTNDCGSNEKGRTVEILSSIDQQIDVNLNIQILPNPAHESVNIVYDMNLISKFELVNLSGISVFEADYPRNMDLSSQSLAKGVYIIKFYTKSGIVIPKKMVLY